MPGEWQSSAVRARERESRACCSGPTGAHPPRPSPLFPLTPSLPSPHSPFSLYRDRSYTRWVRTAPGRALSQSRRRVCPTPRSSLAPCRVGLEMGFAWCGVSCKRTAPGRQARSSLQQGGQGLATRFEWVGAAPAAPAVSPPPTLGHCPLHRVRRLGPRAGQLTLTLRLWSSASAGGALSSQGSGPRPCAWL